jgi:hypothetical protein
MTKLPLKKNIKIFEATTLRQAIKDCLDAGYFPANSKMIYDLKRAKKIPVQWYDSGTLCFKGEFRDVTLEELKNIEKIYVNDGRLVWVGSVGDLDSDDLGLNYISLNYGRLVGVRR